MNDLQVGTAAPKRWLAGLRPCCRTGLRRAYTPVFLRYNTGRHIPDNGHDLAALLEQVLAYCPCRCGTGGGCPRMGGLRCVTAQRDNRLHWPQHPETLVFFNAPHFTAPRWRSCGQLGRHGAGHHPV